MNYAYGVDMREEDGIWYANYPQFEGAFADGETFEEAAKNAADVLKMVIAEHLDEGLPLPDPMLDGSLFGVVVVDVNDETLARTKCLTIEEAAEELGVSRSRVSQLLTSGLLEEYRLHGKRLVTIASVNARKLEARKAGRPAKRQP